LRRGGIGGVLRGRHHGRKQSRRNNSRSETDRTSLSAFVVHARSRQFVAARLHHHFTHSGRRQLLASTTRRYFVV